MVDHLPWEVGVRCSFSREAASGAPYRQAHPLSSKQVLADGKAKDVYRASED